MLAKIYADLAEADKAISHANKVVELEPDFWEPVAAKTVQFQVISQPADPITPFRVIG